LEWTLGKHRVRLGYQFGNNPPATTEQFEIEIVDPRATGWGEPTEGLQLRARPTKARFTTDETPTFEMDMRNLGDKTFGVCAGDPLILQVDREEYGVGGAYTPDTKARDLKPGDQLENWLTTDPERGNWLRMHGKNEPLEWTPGKHRVRLGMQLRSTNKVVVSDHFIVDVDDSGERWSQPVDGLMARLRVSKEVWREDESPTFGIDIQNRTGKDWEFAPAPQRVEVTVGTITYRYAGRDAESSRKVVPVGGRLNNWLVVKPDRSWLSTDGKATPLSWVEGDYVITLTYPLDATTNLSTYGRGIKIIRTKRSRDSGFR
jgi:hypothetical protein